MHCKIIIFVVCCLFVSKIHSAPHNQDEQVVPITIEDENEVSSIYSFLDILDEDPASSLNDDNISRVGVMETIEEGLTNPEEKGEYFEGDILGPLPTIDKRSGLIDTRYRWPNRTLVYEFNSSFPSNFRTTFLRGLNQITGRTCIRFKERTSEADYIHVWQSRGCTSHVGKKIGGGRQNLSLASGCSRMATHIHEVIHAIGFYHEQGRSDRDDYVIINWGNIEEGHEHNFKKQSESVISPFKVPYDYGSIMHYSRTAFSINGKDTITPRQEGAVIGQRNGMSDSDWLKVNNMYCPNTRGYRIKNVQDNYYLQVQGSTAEGTAVVTSKTWVGEDHQKWTIQWEDVSSGRGNTLVSWSQDGGKVKGMNEDSATRKITVKGHSSSKYQLWSRRKIGSENNPWQIVNLGSGRCLYSQGSSQASTMPCNANDDRQLWNIYKP